MRGVQTGQTKWGLPAKTTDDRQSTDVRIDKSNVRVAITSKHFGSKRNTKLHCSMQCFRFRSAFAEFLPDPLRFRRSERSGNEGRDIVIAPPTATRRPCIRLRVRRLTKPPFIPVQVCIRCSELSGVPKGEVRKAEIDRMEAARTIVDSILRLRTGRIVRQRQVWNASRPLTGNSRYVYRRDR